MSRWIRRRGAAAAIAAIAMVVGLSGCSGEPADDSADPAEGNEALAELVSAAQEEGKVTLYSSQTQAGLDAFVQGFTERFPGIQVEALRLLENEFGPRLEAERKEALADMIVSTNPVTLDALAAAGDFADASALEEASEYDTAMITDSGYFEVGAAILTPVWNTTKLPEGISSLEDVLDSNLKGQIGLPEPSAAPFVDMYLYLEEALGEDALKQIADLEPKYYASATAAGQAVVSGEITLSLFSPPPMADVEQGAPVDYLIPDDVWGNRYFGAVLANAPHPNAAQLLAYYMVTAEGQEQVQVGFASVYEDIPGTVSSTASVRAQDERVLDPSFVAEFAKRWSDLGGDIQ